MIPLCFKIQFSNMRGNRVQSNRQRNIISFPDCKPVSYLMHAFTQYSSSNRLPCAKKKKPYSLFTKCIYYASCRRSASLRLLKDLVKQRNGLLREGINNASNSMSTEPALEKQQHSCFLEGFQSQEVFANITFFVRLTNFMHSQQRTVSPSVTLIP